MAQLIHCDYAGCTVLADVLITRIANGETLAWCDEHYLDMSIAIVAAAEAISAGMPPDEPDNAVLADAVGHLADEAAVDDAASRLDGVTAPIPAFPTSPDSSDADARAPEPPTKPADGRKSGRVVSDATPGDDGAPGPSTAAVGATGEVADPA